MTSHNIPTSLPCSPTTDFNSYRRGDMTFHGPGLRVDTTKKFTVVTQFIPSDSTANGDLTEIRRLRPERCRYPELQDHHPGPDSYDSITGAYCDAQKTAFGDTKQFQAKGGLTAMGKAAKNGMVLVPSVWNDQSTCFGSTPPTPLTPALPPPVSDAAHARPYPVPPPTSKPMLPSSTYTGVTTGPTTSTPEGNTSTSTAPPSGTTRVKYDQRGGIGYTVPAICAAGSTCTVNNEYYSQCL
ncbi:hypothetical protein DXG01_012545 [Tephrocybe rancida]|nr:hypothetical protein DXG01_012545 [Tephrocybe rancida]